MPTPTHRLTVSRGGRVDAARGLNLHRATADDTRSAVVEAMRDLGMPTALVTELLRFGIAHSGATTTIKVEEV